MRCPECHVAIEPGAAACASCGLLLIGSGEVKRRREDLEHQRRRASDLDRTHCPFCKGEIERQAITCRHCSEIVNLEYHEQKLSRRRARINYASWVAYALGLVTYLFFRPVGLMAIAAGLLLSIVYYAIPAEPAIEDPKKKKSFLAFLRKQFQLERVAVALPHMKKRRLVFVGTPILAALAGYFANFFILQQPMNEVLRGSQSFSGMSISTHYEYWLVPGVVVYDLKNVSEQHTPLQVHTALLEYAKRLRHREFDRVELRFRGKQKFSIDGLTFRRAGQEYEKRNFAYVLFELPRRVEPNIVAPPTPARPESEARALMEFHNRWYVHDIADERRADRGLQTNSAAATIGVLAEADQAAAPPAPAR